MCAGRAGSVGGTVAADLLMPMARCRGRSGRWGLGSTCLCPRLLCSSVPTPIHAAGMRHAPAAAPARGRGVASALLRVPDARCCRLPGLVCCVLRTHGCFRARRPPLLGPAEDSRGARGCSGAGAYGPLGPECQSSLLRSSKNFQSFY